MIPKIKKETLSKQQTAELVRKAQAGDIEARNKLLLCNIGLVMLTIYRAGLDDEEQGEAFQDLVFCFIACVKNYRENGAAAFPSYLAKSLEFKLRVLLRKYFNRDLPTGGIQAYSARRQLQSKLTQRLGREPLPEEIAAAAGITTEEAGRFMALRPLVYMDGMDDDDPDGLGLADVIPDLQALREAELQDIGQALDVALARLDERSRRVVINFAVNGISLKQIARGMGLASITVAQIRNKACRQLRRMLAETFPELNKSNEFVVFKNES